MTDTKYTSTKPPPNTFGAELPIDRTIRESHSICKSEDTAAIVAVNSRCEVIAMYGPKLTTKVELADPDNAVKVIVGNGIDSIDTVRPIWMSEIALEHTMCIMKVTDAPEEYAENEEVPEAFLNGTRWSGQKVVIFPLPTVAFVPFGHEIPVGHKFNTRAVGDFFVEIAGDEGKKYYDLMRHVISTNNDTETVYRKMKTNGVELCKQYITPKWEKDFNCRGHNYIVNTEPMIVPKMFPSGWEYVQKTFKAKETTTPNQAPSEDTAANRPVINNTVVVKSGDTEEKEQQKKLADTKRSLYYAATTTFDLDAYMPVQSVEAPKLTSAFEKANSYSSSAAAGLVQNVIISVFGRNIRDVVAIDTSFQHCPKQAAQAIVNGNFSPVPLSSLTDEKNAFNCLNWAPQSSASGKARECREREMRYEAELGNNVADQYRSKMESTIPIVGNAIRNIQDIKGLLANTIIGSSSIVIVKLSDEEAANPVIVLAADKLYEVFLSKEVKDWMEKNKELLQHLPFVTLNGWDKVTVACAKLSVSTDDIDKAETEQWNAINITGINSALRTLKKLRDLIMDCAHNDIILSTDNAPSWTPIHFNSDEQMRRKLKAIIDSNTNRPTNTFNRTNTNTTTTINHNNKTNGNNTNDANQKNSGTSNKKPRVELNLNQRKGTVLTKDPAYKPTINDVLGPAKGQFKAFHTYGEECPDGKACKHNHDHIHTWTFKDIEAYVQHLVKSGKMLLNK